MDDDTFKLLTRNEPTAIVEGLELCRKKAEHSSLTEAGRIGVYKTMSNVMYKTLPDVNNILEPLFLSNLHPPIFRKNCFKISTTGAEWTDLRNGIMTGVYEEPVHHITVLDADGNETNQIPLFMNMLVDNETIDTLNIDKPLTMADKEISNDYKKERFVQLCLFSFLYVRRISR
jgi:hypothetical protein